MVEDIEREAFSEVPLKVRVEEVVSSLEEVPSMVKLDAPQLREFTPLILGAKNAVDSGHREDDSRTNSAEKFVLYGDGAYDGGVESGHEMVEKGERRLHRKVFGFLRIG